MIKLVIFDLDGTLLNSIADLGNACNVALKQFGYPLHDEAAYKKFVGNGIYKLVERSLPKEVKDEANVLKVKEAFDVYYKEHSLDQTRPYSGILELLDCLKAQGIICSVVTNKAHNYAVELVKQFFGENIDLILGQREGIPTKPHPYGVLEMMEHYKVTPNQCLYIGDSNVDIQTAQAAGVASVGVLWGFRDEEELRSEGATYLVKDVKELENLILSQNLND
ncbi:MAG: HAD family hydrolase [Cellulosilyticum sp.]|nr:HAD family hydrolase [Cellulosilyticum sp.]